jgi:hypothetical protein
VSDPAMPPLPAGPSRLSIILMILEAGLNGLSTVVPGTAIAGVFLQIITHAMALHQAEAGQPLDLTKLHLEEPVP